MRDFVLLLFNPAAERRGGDAHGVAVVYASSPTDAAEFFRSKYPEWEVERVT